MNKKFLVLVFTLFLCSAVFAQTDYTETVFLKNGSEVKGRIVEYLLGKSYTVITREGGKVVCDIEDVVKITKTFNDFLMNVSVGYDVMQMKFIELAGWPTPYPVTHIRYSEAFVFNVGISF